MKIKFFFLSILALIIFCTGCQNTQTPEIATQIEGNYYDFPEKYTGEIENVIFTTEIVLNEAVEKNGLYSSTATLQSKDNDKVFNELFGKFEITNHVEFEREDGQEIYYEGANGESLYITPFTVFMATPFYQYIVNTFSLEEETYNADLYDTGEEFAFMGMQEAYENASRQIADFGMVIDENYKCFSLNYKMMAENEYAIGNDGKENMASYKENWSEADNCYYFVTHQIWQDCKVQYPIADVFSKICDANAPVQILYSSEGIQMLDINKIFLFEQSNELLKLMNFDEIAEKIAHKYNMMLTDTKYEITKAELFWRPLQREDNKYEMIPAWEIHVLEQSSGRVSQMYMNAVNGEEIL